MFVITGIGGKRFDEYMVLYVEEITLRNTNIWYCRYREQYVLLNSIVGIGNRDMLTL